MASGPGERGKRREGRGEVCGEEGTEGGGARWGTQASWSIALTMCVLFWLLMLTFHFNC